MKVSNFILMAMILFGSVELMFGQNIQQLSPNYFVAGIPSGEFEYYASPRVDGKQKQSNWCWAACTQMVLNYHGLYVKQEQVVNRIYGNLVNRPANSNQIRRALSGWAPNVRGGYSNIYCRSGFNSVNEITHALAYKWPLIVGLKNDLGGVGHAYVLTAIYYSTDKYNNTIPDKVVLRDPWPSGKSRKIMPWREFDRRLIASFKVWVSR